MKEIYTSSCITTFNYLYDASDKVDVNDNDMATF